MSTSPKIELRCVVNGVARVAHVYPMARLLDVLRVDFGLTGTKEGCGEGECGACAVLLDGALVQSCLVPALHAQGASVSTVEGVARDGELDRVQRAMLEHGGTQCGMCTPGMIMAAHALLARYPRPTAADLREGLAGNLCRCTGYTKIFGAVVAACATSKPEGGDAG